MDDLVTYLKTIRTTPKLEKVNKVVVAISGGLDSTTLLHFLLRFYGKDQVIPVSFDYDQRHSVELEAAAHTLRSLGLIKKWIQVDLSRVGQQAALISSMVKGDVKTPTMEDVLGEPQPVTYFPFRNLVISSILASIAESHGCNGIAIGSNPYVDSHLVWDGTIQFYDALQHILDMNRKNSIQMLLPYAELTKAEIVQLGVELNVDFTNCWTCYSPVAEDEDVAYPVLFPCEVCPACKPRAAAFRTLGIVDPLLAKGFDTKPTEI